jgi:hypothetical protein
VSTGTIEAQAPLYVKVSVPSATKRAKPSTAKARMVKIRTAGHATMIELIEDRPGWFFIVVGSRRQIIVFGGPAKTRATAIVAARAATRFYYEGT